MNGSAVTLISPRNGQSSATIGDADQLPSVGPGSVMPELLGPEALEGAGA
jgi:hypothetical protein